MVETGGGSGGIPSIVILVPVIMFVAGVVFLFVAARDERGPKDPAKMFMSRANHPLRHVQVALNADRKRARDKAREAARQKEAEARGDPAPDPAPPKKRKQRPEWPRRVS